MAAQRVRYYSSDEDGTITEVEVGEPFKFRSNLAPCEFERWTVEHRRAYLAMISTAKPGTGPNREVVRLHSETR